MNPQLFKYGNLEHEYYVVQQDRKSIRLTVYPNLKIVLYCPQNYTQEKINTFLKRKALWIKKQVNDLTRLQPRRIKREYVSGESFLYLGRQYKLIVEAAAKNKVNFVNGRIVLQTSDQNKNQEILDKWYLERAETVFKERYKVMLKQFD